MPNCNRCNTYNLVGIRDCKKCGAVLPVNVGDNCPRCHKEAGTFAKSCRYCGYDFLKVKEPMNKRRFNIILLITVLFIILTYVYLQ
ncbi:hypothetical protein CSV73_10185 [Sporosarcina sp. P1]|nr:hypothetical protein CSV73_10185 [Sporosarcina sp. P1]